MEQQRVRTRLILSSIFLFSVVTITAYLQSMLHFNTYLALAICLLDTIVSATLLFNR